MVEPVSIGVIVAALLAKVLGRAEDGVVDGAIQVVRKAFEALRGRFSGDAEAERVLGELADAPDSPSRQRALAELLDARAQDSPDLLAELKAIVAEAEAQGVAIGPIEQVAEGDGNVQVAGAVDSEVSIRIGTPPPPRD